MSKICLKRRILLIEVKREEYVSEQGHRSVREYGLTPNGNPINGYWVLRDRSGTFIDYDKYRSDLWSRNGFDDRVPTLAEHLSKEFA